MDLYETKDRIAVAMVESIFRRARYRVNPFRPDPSGLKFVREEFLPNFHAVYEEEGRDFLLDVAYRPFVDQFIALENKRRDSSVVVLARRHWPSLRTVMVTDHPEPGRSCFQTVVFSDGRAAGSVSTVNLADNEEFGIFSQNVEDHEELLLRIFTLLLTDRYRREPQPHRLATQSAQ